MTTTADPIAEFKRAQRAYRDAYAAHQSAPPAIFTATLEAWNAAAANLERAEIAVRAPARAATDAATIARLQDETGLVWCRVSSEEVGEIYDVCLREKRVFNGCTHAELCTRYGADQVRHIMGDGWYRVAQVPPATTGERVHACLIADGWRYRPAGNNLAADYAKLIENFAPAGTISSGRRIVTLTIDDTGRWLARLDGWRTVERDVDLREFAADPAAAIAAVLQ